MYSGVVYHNYRYQYGQKKGRAGLEAFTQIPQYEIEKAAKLGADMAADFVGFAQLVE